MTSDAEPRPLTDRDLERLASEDSWTVHVTSGGITAVAASRPGTRWFLADLSSDGDGSVDGSVDGDGNVDGDGSVYGAGHTGRDGTDARERPWDGFLVTGDTALMSGAMWQQAVLGWTRAPEKIEAAVRGRWVSTDAAAFARGGADHGVLEQVAKLAGEPVRILWGDDSPAPVPHAVVSREEVVAALRGPVRAARSSAMPKVDVTGPNDGQWHVSSGDLVELWGLSSGPEADDAVRDLLARDHPDLLRSIDLDSYEDVFSAHADSPAPALRLATLLQRPMER